MLTFPFDYAVNKHSYLNMKNRSKNLTRNAFNGKLGNFGFWRNSAMYKKPKTEKGHKYHE